MKSRAVLLGLLVVAACGGGDGAGGPDAQQDFPPGVHGVVYYEDRPPTAAGRLGQIQNLPARGVLVTLINDADMAEIAETVTGEDGSYVLAYDGPAVAAHVMVATVRNNNDRPINVVRLDGRAHGFGGPSFGTTPGNSFVHDVVVTVASGEAQAFNIFDQLTKAVDFVRLELAIPPEALNAQWSRGSTDGTYYYDNENTMHLLGASDDDDGFDDAVILHESGHWIEDTIGRSDSPGGNHGGGTDYAPLAWSEGFSSYWGMAVLDAPLYVDTYGANDGWAFDADEEVTRANPTGTLSQEINEDMVAEILWDLGDGRDPDDDLIAGDHTEVVKVQPEYLGATALRAVGISGVDLVDFLDGWFMSAGLEACAGARAIVVDSRGFPYDFAGPGGTCP